MSSIHISKMTGRADFTILYDESVLVTREGDNLYFQPNGAINKLAIKDFYNLVNEDTEFRIDNQVVSAEDFFKALDAEDLVPAAGPEAKQQADTNSYHEYDNMELAGGLEHLDGLDYATQAGESAIDGKLIADSGMTLTDASLAQAANLTFAHEPPTSHPIIDAPISPIVPPQTDAPFPLIPLPFSLPHQSLRLPFRLRRNQMPV